MENFCSFFLVLGFYRLHSNVLEFRFHPRYFLPAYTVFYFITVIQGSINDWIPQLPLKFLLMILSVLFPVFIYRDPLLKRFFWSFFAYILYTIVEIIILITASFLTQTGFDEMVAVASNRLLFTFIAQLCFLLIIDIILHLLRKKQLFIEDFQLETVSLLGINIFSIVAISGLYYEHNAFISRETALSILFGGFITMSLLSVFILYKITKRSQELLQNRLQLQQMEIENTLNDTLEHVTMNLRNLRHDMNNHFNILQGLLDIAEYEEASAYLKSLSADLNIANNFVFVNNNKLSVLINSKVSKALDFHIPLEVNIHAETFPLTDQDLCSLVGNILENALEACTHTENPSIVFSIQKEGTDCIIRCTNTFSIAPIFYHGRLLTTKEQKEIHGIGTQIIKFLAEKYQGYAEFTVDEKFHVTVCIPYRNRAD